jgi:hypothetical protein
MTTDNKHYEARKYFLADLCRMLGINTAHDYDGIESEEDIVIYERVTRNKIQKLVDEASKSNMPSPGDYSRLTLADHEMIDDYHTLGMPTDEIVIEMEAEYITSTEVERSLKEWGRNR